jgi:hypothetical protein
LRERAGAHRHQDGYRRDESKGHNAHLLLLKVDGGDTGYVEKSLSTFPVAAKRKTVILMLFADKNCGIFT